MSKVRAFVYDISQGMARMMSMSLVGKQIDLIPHTGIVVFGKEYFFGGGPQICLTPGQSVPIAPSQELDLGETTKTAGTHSTFLNNILERVTGWKKHEADSNCPFPGTWKDNMVAESDPEEPAMLNYFAINSEIRWPWGRDFRRCPGSTADSMDAGAYGTYTAKDKYHWIPGALEADASMPSPKDGEPAAIVDADLIFLPPFRSVQHEVYFAEAKDTLKKVATPEGENNIVQVGALKAHTDYQWRVDAVYSDGSKREGPVFTFTTGDDTHKACPPTPSLPPAPHVVSDKCASAMDDCCSKFKIETKTCYHQVKHEKSIRNVCSEEDQLAYCGCSPIDSCAGSDETDY